MNKKLKLLDFLIGLILALIICLPLTMSNSGFTFLGYLGIFLFTLFTGRLFLPITISCLAFQSFQLMNRLTTHNDLYLDQIKVVFTEPMTAFAVANGEISTSTYAIGITYIIAGVWFATKTKTIKINSNNVLIFIFALIITTTYILMPSNYQAKHPLLYLRHILTNEDDIKVIHEGNVLPIKVTGSDLAPKIILVIGESQSSISEKDLRDIMPRLFKRLKNEEIILLENVSQVGSYTAVSTIQILEGLLLNRIHEDHYRMLDIPNTINKKGAYVSSRNTEWVELNKRIKESNIEIKDCRNANPDCDKLGGFDDLVILDQFVLPLLNNDKFFFVWKMNGSHNPIGDKSPSEFKIHKDEYLNSVNYTDYVLNKLISKLPPNTWLFFMADHEKTHNGLTGKVLSFVHHNTDNLSKLNQNKTKPLTQLDIVKTIFELQGTKANTSDNYNIITEIAPDKRERMTFKVQDPTSPTYIQ
jgi:glucan phosphoethanolaminetransferase (alkaline phosphatase superfamily)